MISLEGWSWTHISAVKLLITPRLSTLVTFAFITRLLLTPHHRTYFRVNSECYILVLLCFSARAPSSFPRPPQCWLLHDLQPLQPPACAPVPPVTFHSGLPELRWVLLCTLWSITTSSNQIALVNAENSFI